MISTAQRQNQMPGT